MLVLAASLPTLAAVWLLLAPGVVLSREMTWDLLFALAGAWHLAHGHVPHVDFHTPFGVLGFALTSWGFTLLGPTVHAFLVGELIVLAGGFVAAVLVAARRLSPVPAFLFVVYIALLILQPSNLGDAPYAYSFAMSYNRWGWAALTTFCLALFIAPHPTARQPWLDLTLTTLLVAFLFYLKLTFAVAAMAAVVAAIVTVPHLREQWRVWTGLVTVLGVAQMGPWNHSYFRDAWDSDYERTDLAAHLNTLLGGRFEYALYLIVILTLAWLWQRRWATREAVISAGVLTGLGVLVLSQNAQSGDIPLGLVVTLILYQSLRSLARNTRMFRRSEVVTLFVLVLVPMILSIATATKVLAGYYRAATRQETLAMPQATNLRGLAVPASSHSVAEALAASGHRLLSSPRVPPLRDPVTQAEYVASLLEAATALAENPVTVLVLDQVNPMPFVLGYRPPRGGRLWLSPEEPPPAAADVFDDVQVVLIPKYSSYAPVTAFALATYGDYLGREFAVRSETPSWVILRRGVAANRQ